MGRRVLPITRGLVAALRAPMHGVARALIGSRALGADSLYLFYDLEVSPVTFDFCWALALAELRRVELGLDHVRVVFVPGPRRGLRQETPDYDSVVDTEARRWRVQHILVPLCGLLPSCAGVSICGSRDEAAFIRRALARHVYPAPYDPLFPRAHAAAEVLERAAREGRIAAFRSPPQAIRYVRDWLLARAGGRQVVAITLRDYGFGGDRNSDRGAWTAFAAGLDRRRFFPVFIPDTERAMQPMPPAFDEFAVFSPACWNVQLRAALYELAYLNMGVSTGPMGLAWFMPECRYLMFKVVTPGVAQATEAAIKGHGFAPGASLPFATPLQKWVWEDDDLPVLEREFSAMVDAIDEQTQTR